MRLALASTFLAFTGAAFADEPAKPKPAAAPLTAVNANDLKQQYERTLKEFNDSIEKVKDNPEAKEALEKARDEFKKGMEEKLKEAEKAIPQGREGRGGVFVIPAPNFPNFPADPNLDQLQQLQQELMRERMDALRAMQGAGFGRLPLATGRIGIRLEAAPAVLIEQLGLDKNVGVVIGSVTPGSAAEKAGLKPHDVLLQVDGKDVPADPTLVVRQLAGTKEGDKLAFTVLRKGKKETVEGLVVPAEPRVEIPGRGGVRMATRGMSIQINNGEVTASGSFDGGVEVKVIGTMNGGAVEPTKITVKDGESTNEYDSLDKVPEKYRGRVEKLLGSVGGNRRER